MLNFCSLYSGSSGNSLFVETENTKVLVDVGLSCKKIEEALSTIEKDPNSIDAILITHEHSDHIKGSEKISNKNINYFYPDEKFNINDLEITPFSIPHDAANPCGFTINNEKHQLSIATDIGHMTNDIVKHLEGSELLLLESNYDTEVLKCCKYPFHLKARIAGSTGHLSNTMSGKTISYLLKNSNLNTAILGHLSKESNFPELAYQTVVDELLANNCNTDSINLSVASRELPGRLIKL